MRDTDSLHSSTRTTTPTGTTSDRDAISVIAAHAPIVTLINVFTVEPARQDALLALLDRATEDVMRHLPGFISANLHRGVDGTSVANYAQWASRAAFEAMLRDPAAQVHMHEAAAMATAAPVLYTVASVHPAPASGTA